MKSDLERQHLQTGIIEFDPLFQKEWEDTAKRKAIFTTTAKRIQEIAGPAKVNFLKKLKIGSLSESLVSMADEDIGLNLFGDEVERIHAELIAKTHRSFDATLCPGLNSLQLYRTLCDVSSRHDYNTYTLLMSSKIVLHSAIIFLFFMLVIGLYSQNGGVASLGLVVSILLILVWRIVAGYIRYAVRPRGDKSDDKLVKRMSTLIAQELLQKDSQMLSSDEVFSHAITKLEEIFWTKALELNVSSECVSPTLREVHNMITACSGEETGYAEFKTLFAKITDQYQYMRSTIIKVGEDVYEGHRVPSRYKKTKIQLVRCPQCGGPFANEMDSRCPYCDSVFVRF